MSRLECMAESMRLALKRLADLLEDADFERLVPAEIRELYTDELTTQNMDEQTVRRSLRSAGGHALTLLNRVAGHSKGSELSIGRFSPIEGESTARTDKDVAPDIRSVF